jgi:drug/metabolite transporter (DMT)-like permease
MDNRQPKPLFTALLTVLAMIAFAANSIFGRLALGEPSIDPTSYTAVRLISGAIALWIIASMRKKAAVAASVAGWAAAVMLFTYAITFSFAYISLSAGTGALILFAAVQITMIAVGLHAGERPPVLEWLGLFIAIIGLVYLVSPGVAAPSLLGSLLMATAGIAWGIYSLLGRGAENPLIVTRDNFFLAVPFALVGFVLSPSALTISSSGFLWAALSGSVTSAMGYAIWYAALRGLSATLAATVQLSVPVIAALGGVVLLSERFTLRLLVSGAAILAGVGLAIYSHRK